MKQVSCFALLLIVLLYAGCKKSYISPIDFTKITVTDSSCIFISDVDTTDWTYDAAWTKAETALIGFKDSVRVLDSITGYIQVSAICGNPNNGSFAMHVNTERECQMRIACVNNQMEILDYTVKYYPGGPVTYNYDFRSNTAFHPNESYRLYYGFFNSKDSLYYKGHGDFRIE